MGGVGLIPPAGPSPAEPISGRFDAGKAGANIAVFDSFGLGTEATHGEDVISVIGATGGFGDQNIQRFTTGNRVPLLETVRNAPPGQATQNLGTYVEATKSGLLEATSNNLETILTNPTSQGITTINQSQGMSKARVAERILNEMGNDPQLEAQVIGGLGLPPNAQGRDIVQAVSGFVDNVVDNSLTVSQSQQRHVQLSQLAEQRGINHVVSAGNEGAFAPPSKKTGSRSARTFSRVSSSTARKRWSGLPMSRPVRPLSPLPLPEPRWRLTGP